MKNTTETPAWYYQFTKINLTVQQDVAFQ
jgi:hypothetical protein